MRTIRAVNKRDLNKIIHIEFESFSDPYPLHFFRYLAENAPELFLVAVENEELLGYIVADIEQDAGVKIGHLLSVAVRSDKRRVGVGNELIASLKDVLTKKGCREVVLEVRVSNDSAKNFYKKHGFKETRRTRKYYSDGEDALVMRLLLEEKL